MLGCIDGKEVYVVGHDPQTYKEVKEDLLRRLGSDRVTVMQVGNEEVLAVKAHYDSFLKMNLGMPTDEMKAVNDAGFHVLARPSNYEDCTPDDVKAVFARLDGFAVSEIVFSGQQSLGAPKALQTTIDEMKERQINLGLIEAVTQLQFYKQDGMEEIAKGLGYDHVARLYSIPKDEQPKLKIDTAVERWSNTDEERNIRIDLLRIYDKPSPNMSLMETNMKYFQETHDKLVAHGYTIGKAGTFETYNASKVLRAFVMLGVAAAGILTSAHPAPQCTSALSVHPACHLRPLGGGAGPHGQWLEDPRRRGARQRECLPGDCGHLPARPRARLQGEGPHRAAAPHRDGGHRALRHRCALLHRCGVPLGLAG